MSRPSTSFSLSVPKTWMPGTRPGMTTEFVATSRSARAMLRPPPKCQQLASGLQPGRIVEEPLAEYLVAAPFLQSDLVKPAHLAGFFRQFENPVNCDMVAFDRGRHRLGIDMRHPRQRGALVGDQHIAADARRAC